MRARVRGIDAMMRELAMTNIRERQALKDGVHDAAEYLQTKIEAKMGVYQSSGGSGGGSWAKLKWETNKKKLRKYGFSGKPLIGTGHMKDSFYVHDTDNKKNVMSSVANSDPKMVHHVYGAPMANLPPRDPMLIASIEEKEECRRIIINRVYQAYR